MKLSIIILAAAVGCGAAQPPEPPENKPGRISVRGTRFVQADGLPFEWRGVTAFRLAELVATGKVAEAAAYLDWAAASGVTVVRVLSMARHLFPLAPEQGVAALPRLLKMAADRGLHVEVVALADTADLTVDLDAHVAAVGRIAAEHPNAFVEIANEPFHPTQHPSLHDRATLARLAALIPGPVVVAFGSDAPGRSGGGDYVTVHMPRGDTPWEHVGALAQGRDLVTKYGRPVVSDEPMGAAETAQPGRRDNSAERFRAAALLTRMTGMHATFHYEGGLHARIPRGAEKAAFDAWREAWTILPRGIEQGTFRKLQTPKGEAYESRLDGRRWVLTIGGPSDPPAGLTRQSTWRESALFVGK